MPKSCICQNLSNDCTELLISPSVFCIMFFATVQAVPVQNFDGPFRIEMPVGLLIKAFLNANQEKALNQEELRTSL